MQAERQLNRESVTCVTFISQYFRFQSSGGTHAEVDILQDQCQRPSRGTSALSPGLFLITRRL